MSGLPDDDESVCRAGADGVGVVMRHDRHPRLDRQAKVAREDVDALGEGVMVFQEGNT